MSVFPTRTGPPGSHCSLFSVSAEAGVPRYDALSPNESCSTCNRSWLAHTPIIHQSNANYQLRRGPCTRTGCGGFYSTKPIWTQDDRCVCTASWHDHEVPEHPQPVPIAASHSATRPSAASLAITRFTGVPAPQSRAANAERLSGRQPNRVVAQHLGQRSRQTPSALLRSQMTSAAAPRTSASQVPPPSDNNLCNICLLARRWTSQAGLAHDLKARFDYRHSVLDFFKTNYLCFDFDVEAQGPIDLERLTSKLTTRLHQHNISFGPLPSGTDYTSGRYCDQPWFLLSKSSASRASGVITWGPHPRMAEDLFTAAALTSVKAQDYFPHPEPGKYLVFLGEYPSIPRIHLVLTVWHLASRFSPMRGPGEAFSSEDEHLEGTHACWSLRLLALFPNPTGSTPYVVHEFCIEGCPTRSDGEESDGNKSDVSMARSLSPRISTVARPHSPPSPPQARAHRRPRLASPVFDSMRDDDLLLQDLIPAASPTQRAPSNIFGPPVPGSIPGRLPIRDSVTVAAVISWSVGVVAKFRPAPVDSGYEADTFSPVSIHTKTEDAAGAAILGLLLQTHQCEKDQSAEYEIDSQHKRDVFRVIHPIRLEAWFHVFKNIQIGPSFGAGPTLAAMHAALTAMVTKGGYWEQVLLSDMYRPSWSPMVSDPERFDLFFTHGQLLAIYILNQHQGPFPVSIWLLLTLVDGPGALASIPSHILRYFEPDLWAQVKWIYNESAAPTMANVELRTFIIDVLDVQPSTLPNLQDPENRHHFVIAALGKLLLGHTEFFERKEWVFLRDGFNIERAGLKVIESIHTTWPGMSLPFLCSLYDREIKSIGDVSANFTFEVHGESEREDGTTVDFVRLFKWRLHRYLQGRGHPSTSLGFVTEEELEPYRKSIDDPLFRAKLFYFVMTENRRLIGPAWPLAFTFYGNPDAYEGSNAAGRPITFHTCTQSCAVFLDEPLETTLLQPPEKNREESGRFDGWLHLQLLNAAYNLDG
ncbi:hypothetical protein C8F01DRAFT_1365612 [Mycena amicta]|nr:hypothetical protein C8F01DRAFT_1365612 [Mycena amicta]